MNVTQLFIYPIKSLGGIEVDVAEVQRKGLQYDRRWMIIDENNMFLSQREHPEMAQFAVHLDASHLTIDFRGDQLIVPIDPPTDAPRIPVQIWDDECTALRYGRAIQKWLSDRLDQACSLVYMPDELVRPMKPKYAKTADEVSFADGYPLLVLGESSLDDLNARLDEPVDIRRFRPNIVFSGAPAYAEDGWKSFQIGEVPFRGIKPCPRCQVVTIDPDSGLRGSEPLKTLATYRAIGNKVMFGLNACWEPSSASAIIRPGDQIRFIS